MFHQSSWGDEMLAHFLRHAPQATLHLTPDPRFLFTKLPEKEPNVLCYKVEAQVVEMGRRR
jgi:hypothetical protein